MNNIRFFKEEIHFRLLQQQQTKEWIRKAIRHHAFQLQEINFILCSDDYLLRLNKKFLNHDFYTDIITFDHAIEQKKISADIFISIDRVRHNAEKFSTDLRDELHRVMIHGVLHLMGYRDKTKKDRAVMSKAEDEWLGKRRF